MKQSIEKFLEDLDYWYRIQGGGELITGITGIGIMFFFLFVVQKFFCSPMLGG